MSDRITIGEGDIGHVWVFAVDLDEQAARAFGRRNGTWPVQEALGADTLDPDHVDFFPVSDLDDLGLAGYLHEGLGVPEEQLRDMRPQLDALKGYVLVVTSRAFGGKAQTLAPRAPLRLVASFSEERPPVVFEPLPSEAAAGTLAGPPAAGPPPLWRGWIWLLLLFGVLAAITLLALVLS